MAGMWSRSRSTKTMPSGSTRIEAQALQYYGKLAEMLHFSMERQLPELEGAIRDCISHLPLGRCVWHGCDSDDLRAGSAFCMAHYDEVCGSSRLVRELLDEPPVLTH